ATAAKQPIIATSRLQPLSIVNSTLQRNAETNFYFRRWKGPASPTTASHEFFACRAKNCGRCEADHDRHPEVVLSSLGKSTIFSAAQTKWRKYSSSLDCIGEIIRLSRIGACCMLPCLASASVTFRSATTWSVHGEGHDKQFAKRQST